MIYTLRFESRFGLWELKINKFRARFYRTRDEAMKLVTRYRRASDAEQAHQIGVINNTMTPFMRKLYDALEEPQSNQDRVDQRDIKKAAILSNL